jgi:hypothetical protein
MIMQANLAFSNDITIIVEKMFSDMYYLFGIWRIKGCWRLKDGIWRMENREWKTETIELTRSINLIPNTQYQYSERRFIKR